jgi:hypothetical protein
MRRIVYDATKTLEIGDFAEISVINDHLNARLLEETYKELEVEILCPPKFRQNLRQLQLNHACVTTYIGDTPHGVSFKVSSLE